MIGRRQVTNRFHVMPSWFGFLGVVFLEEQGNAELRLVNKSPWCEPHAAQTRRKYRRLLHIRDRCVHRDLRGSKVDNNARYLHSALVILLPSVKLDESKK